MSGDRIANGETLIPVWAWLWDDYLISAAGAGVAESGIGYHTLAHITWSEDHTVMRLSHVATLLSCADAVQAAKAHKAERAA